MFRFWRLGVVIALSWGPMLGGGAALAQDDDLNSMFPRLLLSSDERFSMRFPEDWWVIDDEDESLIIVSNLGPKSNAPGPEEAYMVLMREPASTFMPLSGMTGDAEFMMALLTAVFEDVAGFVFNVQIETFVMENGLIGAYDLGRLPEKPTSKYMLAVAPIEGSEDDQLLVLVELNENASDEFTGYIISMLTTVSGFYQFGSGESPAAPLTAEEIDWVQYTADDDELSVMLPADWEVVNDEYGSLILLPDMPTDDQAISSIVILIDMETYTDALERELAMRIANKSDTGSAATIDKWLAQLDIQMLDTYNELSGYYILQSVSFEGMPDLPTYEAVVALDDTRMATVTVLGTPGMPITEDALLLILGSIHIPEPEKVPQEQG